MVGDQEWINWAVDVIQRSRFSNRTRGFLKHFIKHCNFTFNKVYQETDEYTAYYIAGTFTMWEKMWQDVQREIRWYIIFDTKVRDGYRYTLAISNLLSEVINNGNFYCYVKYKEKPLPQIEVDTSAERDSERYKEWVNEVLERDGHKCQCCGSTLNPEVHHIIPYSKAKDKRTDIHNGITLCEMCHSSRVLGGFHQVYGTRNNTPEQLQEYFDNKRKLLHLPQVSIWDIVK